MLIPRRLASFAFLLLLPPLASGTPLEFLPEHGEWGVPANWSGDQVPTPVDTAIIGSGRTVEVADGTTANARLAEVGGRGALLVAGTLETSTTIIGSLSGGSGDLTVSTGMLSSGQLRVRGYLSSLLQTGGAIQTTQVEVDDAAGMTIDGGKWQTEGAFIIGVGRGNSPATFTLRSGTLRSADGQIGSAGTGDGVANVEGGRWDIEESLKIGGEGKGELHLSGQGVVSVGEGSGPIFLGDGVLRIGTGGGLAAGRISGDARSELHFDHAEVRTWNPTISGGMSVDHYGSGTTIIRGFNLYSGPTNIFNGTLLVVNQAGSATGTGPVRVTRGGTLAGSGAVLGEVMLENGGAIRPSGGNLRIGNLTWTEGGSLTLGVGPGAAKLLVESSLQKGEGNLYRIEMIDAGAVIGETYTLVEFASTNFKAEDFHVHGRGHLVVTGTALEWTPTAPSPPPSRSVAVNVRRGAGKSAIFTITNAGNVEDRYHLRAQRRIVPESSGNGKGGEGKRRIGCRYSLDGENVSDAAERGSITTRVLRAGDSATLRVSVDVRSPLKLRKRLVSGIEVVSVSDTTVTGKASKGIRLDGDR